MFVLDKGWDSDYIHVLLDDLKIFMFVYYAGQLLHHALRWNNQSTTVTPKPLLKVGGDIVQVLQLR